MQGKVPPQNLEAEAKLIGELLVGQNEIPEVLQIVNSEMFYNTRHKIIMQAIEALYHRGEVIDLITVSKQFSKHPEMKEMYLYIAQLTNDIALTYGAQTHAAIILEKYIQRSLIEMSSNVVKMAHDDTDPLLMFELIDNITGRLRNTSKDNTKHISEIAKEVMQIMERNQHLNNTLTGIPTGFDAYDRLSGGLQEGELIVIAGETSQGKTALAMNICLNASVDHKKKVAVITLEMTDKQLAARAMAAQSGLNSKMLLHHKIEHINWAEFTRKITPLINSDIYIDHVASSEKNYIETTIRNIVSKYGIDLVIVDYLQLIRNSSKGKSTADSVAEIANDMKRMAHTIRKPIILLSQLARDRDNPKPTLSRLKNSGDIENAADVVWFVWRPETYDKNKGTRTHDINGRSYEISNLAHCIIAKGRNIGTFDFPLTFIKGLTKFQDYSEFTIEEAERSPF